MLLNQLSRALYEICSTQKTNLYIYIERERFAELDYLVEDIYCYSANLHIALVYLLSTLIADEIFNSLYYYIIYIYIYIYIYINNQNNNGTDREKSPL